MNQRIFNIFKALRHFGVMPREAFGIANAYQWWFENQVEKFPSFGTAYLLSGTIYSMPYNMGPKNRLIGIEIDGTIYLAGYLQKVRLDQLETKISTYKAKLLEKFASLNGFDLRLPTREEVKKLVEIVEFIPNCFTQSGDVWITPPSDQPDKKFVSVNGRNVRICRRLSNKTCATLYLVVRPEENFIKGKVDEYGKPTEETLAHYEDLRKNQ